MQRRASLIMRRQNGSNKRAMALALSPDPQTGSHGIFQDQVFCCSELVRRRIVWLYSISRLSGMARYSLDAGSSACAVNNHSVIIEHWGMYEPIQD